MFFRLPVVRFFNHVINRATVTVALVLLQIGWLLWAFFSLTAGKVWVNAGLSVLASSSPSTSCGRTRTATIRSSGSSSSA